MANIKVPYLDLKAQYQSIKPEIDAALARVLDSCQFVLGPEVAAFEQEFAAYCGTAECIALNSGTSALHLGVAGRGHRSGR
jgi:dTDP-4-amino-4,6-dideoxygalactose transaminase